MNKSLSEEECLHTSRILAYSQTDSQLLSCHFHSLLYHYNLALSISYYNLVQIQIHSRWWKRFNHQELTSIHYQNNRIIVSKACVHWWIHSWFCFHLIPLSSSCPLSSAIPSLSKSTLSSLLSLEKGGGLFNSRNQAKITTNASQSLINLLITFLPSCVLCYTYKSLSLSRQYYINVYKSLLFIDC
jgi:hypothetical protein